MKHPHPVVEALRRVPLFVDLHDRELRRLAEHADLHHFRAGSVVLLEGYHGEQLHVIVDGEAVVRRRGVELAVLGPGASFGEVGMLNGTDRNATVLARTSLRTLVIDRDGFSELVRHRRIAQILLDEARRHQPSNA